MDNQKNWGHRNLQLGRILLAGGLLIAVAGVLLPYLTTNTAFNTRIVSGAGILILGIGIGYLSRYKALQRGDVAVSRMLSEERDERAQLLRARAGNRAYWVSAALAYLLLMWVSFADDGGLPPLTPDVLWYSLVAVVVLPFGVYAANILYEEKVH